MMKGFISKNVLSILLVSTLILLAGKPKKLYAATPKGCAQVYYQAASVIDQKRAHCGLGDDEETVFCKIAGQTNIPVTIEGFSFNVNVGEVYRILSALHLIPNEFRQSAKLIQQAYVKDGFFFNGMVRKMKRSIPGITKEEVATALIKANEDQSICQENNLLSRRQIRLAIEDELVRQ